jgi:hypothetical protein
MTMAVARRSREASLGNRPHTRVRRAICKLRFSHALEVRKRLGKRQHCETFRKIFFHPLRQFWRALAVGVEGFVKSVVGFTAILSVENPANGGSDTRFHAGFWNVGLRIALQVELAALL